MKRYLLQEVDRNGKVIRSRNFSSRVERDRALLWGYMLFRNTPFAKEMHKALLRDPDGYVVTTEGWDE